MLKTFHSKNITPLPKDWIDRLFERLEMIYKENWKRQFEVNGKPKPERVDLAKTTWATGLAGLSAEEIKAALNTFNFADPTNVPTVIEFYHAAKRIRMPLKKKQDLTYPLPKRDPVVAKKFMDEIRCKLSA